MKYEGRPFKDVEEMNEFMLNRWNALVKPDDIVFILGDILFGGAEVFERIFPKLNGKKYLIMALAVNWIKGIGKSSAIWWTG